MEPLLLLLLHLVVVLVVVVVVSSCHLEESTREMDQRKNLLFKGQRDTKAVEIFIPHRQRKRTSKNKVALSCNILSFLSHIFVLSCLPITISCIVFFAD